MFFTGSDWCIWCQRLHEGVLDKTEFAEFSKKLVLVELDFPQEKELPAELKKQNAELAEKFKVDGYPCTVVLAADGETVLGKLSGYTPEYIDKIQDILDGKGKPVTMAELEKQFDYLPDMLVEYEELKLTKAVTYKKTPIRVNGTYYIGIFEDAAHKKILYKKAMALANASSMTSTLKINLYKLKSKSQSITLYFAETDSKGNVVSGGKKTGYNISLNQTSVTLSPSNAEASVILTNDIIKGSKAAQRLTDPSSGFAGDRSALAEAQHLANTNSVTGRKTGDDSPIGPLALAAMISGGVILLLAAVILLRRRRKRRGEKLESAQIRSVRQKDTIKRQLYEMKSHSCLFSFFSTDPCRIFE